MIDGLGAGSRTLKLQFRMASGASQCLFGWDGDLGNVIVEEIPAGATDRVLIRNFADVRNASGSNTTLTGREVAFTKASATSKILVTYSDTFGHQYAAHNDACMWRLT
jgi:hypothetical protein